MLSDFPEVPLNLTGSLSVIWAAFTSTSELSVDPETGGGCELDGPLITLEALETVAYI